jgi:hypothetical protein
MPGTFYRKTCGKNNFAGESYCGWPWATGTG